VNDRHNRYYAPQCFAQEAAARATKLSQAKFEAAMNRLFAAGVIHTETYGRVNRSDPPHRASRLTGTHPSPYRYM
jgi:hypothetical protein